MILKTILIRLLFIITLSICYTSENANGQNTVGYQTSEVMAQKALEFINSYVSNCNKMSESIEVVKWTQQCGFTTKRFNTALKKMIDDALKAEPELGLDADPIFDAQDYPENGFELDSFDANKSQVIVKGKTWPEFRLTITMVNEHGKWLVDGCGMVKAKT